MIENVILGIQGWEHPEWVGHSYPPDIRLSEMLGEYSRHFPTVEVDDTFYGIPPEPLLRQWLESVPPRFTFALKAPQQITHELRFAAGGGLLNRFLDRVSRLEDRLGPVVLLAPPGFLPDDENRDALRRFLEGIPSDFRWALELRRKAWFTESLFDMLEKRNVALVVGENRWIRRPRMLELAAKATADFAYIRWNGARLVEPPTEKPGHEEHPTAVWAKALERLSGQVGTVFGYFNVRAFGDGLQCAEALRRVFGQRWPEDSVVETTSASERGDSAQEKESHA